MHYAKDVDTYFVVEVMERVEYRTKEGIVYETWGNVCRLVPVNRFGNLILRFPLTIAYSSASPELNHLVNICIVSEEWIV